MHNMHSIQRRCYRKLSRQQVCVLLCRKVKVISMQYAVGSDAVIIGSWSYRLRAYMFIAQITLSDLIFR